MKHLCTLIICISFTLSSHSIAYAQVAECPYPILFMHGWTGSNESWEEFYTDPEVVNIWGDFDTNDQIFWAMPNAEDTHGYYDDCCTALCLFQCTYIDDALRNDDVMGADGVFDDNGEDDDVQWIFSNEDNVLVPGCMYAYSFNVGKDSNGEIFKNPSVTSTAPCDDCSDNNEAGIYKQGYAIKQAIDAILTANPTKDKVILVGHSMGGMAGREYIQRQDSNGDPQWWIDPLEDDGHRVAKFVTLGSPLLGSNTAGNLLRPGKDKEEERLNGFFDLSSEAIRDIRYSYEDGTIGPDIPGVYLYGGDEADIPINFGNYHSHDVDCDGDQSGLIEPMNEDGTVQGYDDVWDGTTYNPNMPLPTNLKYSYYVSSSDGVVDDKRQWLYTGGDGQTGDYNNDLSISEPHDGVDHRLSDRYNSTLFHTSQNNDIDGIVKLLDEGDYPYFAWDVSPGDWYFGTVQERAEKVPMDSEHTGSGDSLIDGDWYLYTLADTAYTIGVDLIPHPSVGGRIDIYTDTIGLYSNANGIRSSTWSVGTTQTISTTSPLDNYLPGDYYIRVTHDINTYTGDVDQVWHDAYQFMVTPDYDCVTQLVITDPGIEGLYRAHETIECDIPVGNQAYTRLEAGQSVEMQIGFETVTQVSFEAVIHDCVD